MKVYPNPAERSVRVESDKMIHSLKLTNLLGQEVLSDTGLNAKNYNMKRNGMAPGVYLLHLKYSDGGYAVFRIVFK